MEKLTGENRTKAGRARPFDRGAIRIAAFDLDGTLINGSDPIHPAVRSALADLAASGVTVVASSGRCTVQIPPELRRCFSYLVCVNGAYVVDMSTGGLLFSHPIEPAAVEEIRRILRRFHGVIYLHREGLALTSPRSVPFILCEARRMHARMGRSSGLAPLFERLHIYYRYVRFTLFPFRSIRRSGEACHKFQCFFRRDADRRSAAEAFRALGLTVLEMSDGTLELTSPGVTKAAALSELAACFGGTENCVCAFGDSENDREMLTHAGHAVVMGNADPALFALADTVAPPVSDDGAATAIRALFGV